MFWTIVSAIIFGAIGLVVLYFLFALFVGFLTYLINKVK
jgi:hypothetical protein